MKKSKQNQKVIDTLIEFLMIAFLFIAIILSTICFSMFFAGFLEENLSRIEIREYKIASNEVPRKKLVVRICSITDTDVPVIEETETETETETESAPKYLIDVTDEEIDLMARVVMSEASVLNSDSKQAVAQVIVNRVRSNFKQYKYQTTVSEVINKPKQFSTQDNGTPNAECYEAVYAALTYEGFPPDMLWFWKSKTLPEENTHIFHIKDSEDHNMYFFTVEDYEVEP